MSTKDSKDSKFAKFAEETSTDDTPADVEIVARDGEPYVRKQDGKPMMFHVVGEYSKQYRAADRKLIDKTLKRARKGDNFDAEDAEDSAIERTASGLVGWTLEVDGKDVPFSKENAMQFLSAAPWNVKNVQNAITGHTRFFKRASVS